MWFMGECRLRQLKSLVCCQAQRVGSSIISQRDAFPRAALWGGLRVVGVGLHFDDIHEPFDRKIFRGAGRRTSGSDHL